MQNIICFHLAHFWHGPLQRAIYCVSELHQYTWPITCEMFLREQKHIFTFCVTPPADMAQVAEILSKVRQEFTYST